jgi:hypothetical protein
MYSKINYKFSKPIYTIIEELKTFTDSDKKGIHYKKIWSPEEEKIYNILPKNVWKDFHMSLMTINREIPPHTDSDINVSINFYIETDDCKTTYYEALGNELNSFQIQNQTDGYVYDKKQLREIGSFIAQPMEIWVLNVKKIHGVDSVKKEPFRKAITLATKKYEYDDVYNMLKQNGNI